MTTAGTPHQARVLLDPRRLIAPVDRRIFGGFVEHIGRAIYGGVLDPGSELSDEQGFRRDVLEAVRGLGATCIRYPGGNFASAYDWRDGIGPREARPARLEPAWQQLEPNTFGTHEFAAWCRAAGAEPMLTVNLGSGAPADAAAWVEYCNAAADTALVRQRRENGQNEPFGVKLWCLGNEIDGPWQTGHTTADRYAEKARQAARMMRDVDPSIQLILAGSSGDFLPTYLQWDHDVLQACWEDVDYLGVHRYSHNRDGDTPWYLAEGVAIDRMLDDFAALLRYVQAVRRSPKRVHLAVDEWNIWYRAKGDRHERGNWQTGAPLLQEGYNLEDALVAGQYLASFIRHADIVKVACLAQLVNALAPLITTPKGLLRQSIYHPFALFARHAGAMAADVLVQSPLYQAGDCGEVPALDVAATLSPAGAGSGDAAGAPSGGAGTAGRWSIFLTNRFTDRPLPVALEWSTQAPSAGVEAWQLTGENPTAANTFAEPERINPRQIDVTPVRSGTATLDLPPLSLTVLSFA